MHVSIDFYLCKNDWKVESQFVGTDHLCSIVWFLLSIDRLLLFLSSSWCWMTFCSASFLFGDKEFKSMIPTFLPRNHCNQTENFIRNFRWAQDWLQGQMLGMYNIHMLWRTSMKTNVQKPKANIFFLIDSRPIWSIGSFFYVVSFFHSFTFSVIHFYLDKFGFFCPSTKTSSRRIIMKAKEKKIQCNGTMNAHDIYA